MSELVDRERIAELEQLMKEPLAEIVAELTQSMDESIDRAQAALTDGDLLTAARAAHRCRNDALIVGAGPLQQALATLETASRAGETPGAQDAFAAVADAWSKTRPELLHAAQAR
ncbi:MAG TPA: Hpt domain-containing protein [Solirubrobacteraceae bacterium]|jgi:HPt (histidine-containing phosphotransfer) domain-containing protein